ncbi:hypothetical protein DFS34DRAFT_648632 [Phlyctochytrium arcticum]|nr:hypothetical protein DFS34DRAFT_648632 [Phlyctochytrium arcticum]
MRNTTIIFSIPLAIMRSKDYHHRTPGRVSQAPKKAPAFKWNVNAAEFVPAAMRPVEEAAAAAAEHHLNPRAEPFVPETQSTVHMPAPFIHTTYPSPYCYGQWPFVYIYVFPPAPPYFI